MIYGPPLQSSSNELADWLELEVLCSNASDASTSAINQTLEMAEDHEPVELDEENLVAERRLQQVICAIHERAEAMGESYPFELNSTGDTLALRATISNGGYAYLFCLIVSAAAPDGLLAGDGPWRPDLAEARKLFQVCATIASAGHVGGPAFSVGWPRPDSSSFLEKLNSAYGLFGDGQPHSEMPAGAPTHVKDDEIDVIAWQHTNEVKPAMGYFLGQAASGADWPDKSLKGHADRYHATWFTKAPVSQLRVGTIMPFCLPSPADADPEDHRAQEEIEGQLRRHSATHGDVLHRHRVALFLEKGAALHASGIGPIERVEDLPAIVNYVRSYRERLRAAAEES